MKKVISFDLWGTLIKANPAFHTAKIELTQKYFNIIDVQEIEACYDFTKEFVNIWAESIGYSFAQEDIFRMLFARLRGEDVYVEDTEDFVDAFIMEYENLFATYPPLNYTEDVPELLQKFARDYDLYLISNTVLISGNALMCTIPWLDLDTTVFTDVIFSDEMGTSKPCIKNFQGYDKKLHISFHIGDNPRTDGLAAENAGAYPIIINSNDKTLEDAYDFILI